MPLWTIYHTPDAFPDVAAKQALAKDITAFFTTKVGLPAFYVVVNFILTPAGTAWKGGEIPDRPFVRLAIEHIAVRLESSVEDYNATTASVEEVLKPHIADKGYDWEFHIDETERGLWRVNGFIPPPWGSEAEKLWVKLNRTVPYEVEEGFVTRGPHSPVKAAALKAAEAGAGSKQ